MIEVHTVDDEGDSRGESYGFDIAIEWLGSIADIHLSTIRPGFRRGDHFHELKYEVLVVAHTDQWRLLYDEGPRSGARVRTFKGHGVSMLFVPPDHSHAIKNTGGADLRLIGLSNRPYDPGSPDVVERVLPALETDAD